MNKKSLNRKIAQDYIAESRDNGKSNQEIYDEMSQLYYGKKSIALYITSTVTTENKNKYKVYNNILLGLLGASILFKLSAYITYILSNGQFWPLLFVMFIPLFTGYFMYEIARYNAPIYQYCGILTIIGFLQSMSKAENGVYLLIDFVFAGAVAGLSFYLYKNMFPDYSPKNLKQDSKGEYILNEQNEPA